jgi:hypothetical protein
VSGFEQAQPFIFHRANELNSIVQCASDWCEFDTFRGPDLRHARTRAR